MDNNNAILFTFGIILVLVATYSAIVQDEFTGQSTTFYLNNTVEEFQEEAGEIDNLADPFSSGKAVATFFTSLLFWTFNIPIWLNLVFLLMRVIIVVIIYDKVRGI